jgi:hypothetical protein
MRIADRTRNFGPTYILGIFEHINDSDNTPNQKDDIEDRFSIIDCLQVRDVQMV